MVAEERKEEGVSGRERVSTARHSSGYTISIAFTSCDRERRQRESPARARGKGGRKTCAQQ